VVGWWVVAHGADLDRVFRVDVRDRDGETLFTLPDDVELLEQAIEGVEAESRKVGMVVIDPIGAFLSDAVDSHRDASVRRALAPLAALAERRDLVVVVVAHLTKDESARLINRIVGAGAFVNAARSVLVFARDPEDPDGEQGRRRVIVHAASNWGRHARTLTGSVESRVVETEDGARSEVGVWVSTGESDLWVEDLQRGGDDGVGADCEEEIAALLEAGSRASREIKQETSAKLGCSRKTVQRAAMRMRDRGELVVHEKGSRPKEADAPRRTTDWELADVEDKDTRESGHARTPARVPTSGTRIPKPNPEGGELSGDTPLSPRAREGFAAPWKCAAPDAQATLGDPGEPREPPHGRELEDEIARRYKRPGWEER
jgi:hypothetical protein